MFRSLTSVRGKSGARGRTAGTGRRRGSKPRHGRFPGGICHFHRFRGNEGTKPLSAASSPDILWHCGRFLKEKCSPFPFARGGRFSSTAAEAILRAGGSHEGKAHLHGHGPGSGRGVQTLHLSGGVAARAHGKRGQHARGRAHRSAGREGRASFSPLFRSACRRLPASPLWSGVRPESWRESRANFALHESLDGEHRGRRVLVSPDVAPCDACLADMADLGNRRFGYAFTNCTNCGPRYTITQSIPYDRPVTSMACFPMCAPCAEEYHDPADRRFHAQPNACPECGPVLWLDGDPAWLSEAKSALFAGARHSMMRKNPCPRRERSATACRSTSSWAMPPCFFCWRRSGRAGLPPCADSAAFIWSATRETPRP